MCIIDENTVQSSKNWGRSLVGLGVQAIQEREFDDLKLFKSIIKEGAKPKV